jgi:predicted AAA+ superfamily ATPase
MFERRITPAVREALLWAPVVLVEGARQVGKSVLVRDLLGPERPAAYVTLDDALQLAAAVASPQDFVLGLPDPVTLDEVQRAPELFRAIKLSVDRDRRPGRFLLSGSASLLLLPRLSDSLAGRVRRLAMWPLSQGEIEGEPDGFVAMALADGSPPRVSAGEGRPALARRLARGGFPEAVTLPEGPVRDGWMRDYIATLLDRDVRDITAVSDRVGLPRLLQVLAIRSSTLLNSSALSRDSGIPRGTIDRFTELFRTTFMLQLVPAWAGDSARRLMKSPKILFVDSGLASHLAGLDVARLEREPDRFGRLLESFVGGELVRQLTWVGERATLLHYRDSAGGEVDWVIEDAAGRLVGIEVKATTAPSPQDLKGLHAFRATVGHRFHRGILLHAGQDTVPLGDGIWAMPVEALWRTLAK